MEEYINITRGLSDAWKWNNHYGEESSESERVGLMEHIVPAITIPFLILGYMISNIKIAMRNARRVDTGKMNRLETQLRGA